MMNQSTKLNHYDYVTQLILEYLEKDTAPWRKPWSDGISVSVLNPCNASNLHQYQGVNVLLLWSRILDKGYTQSKWLTYNQIQNLKGNVRKGQHGTKIVYAKPWEKEKKDKAGQVIVDENGVVEMITGMSFGTHAVFNISQCDNLPQDLFDKEVLEREVSQEKIDALSQQRLDNLFKMVKGMGLTYYEGQSNSAFYNPESHSLTMPQRERFDSIDDFVATLAHELVHSTGGKNFLNRDFKGQFGSQKYAYEELVAEIGSAMLSAKLGIPHLVENSAAYVKSWVKMLSQDNRAIFLASRRATEAVTLLLSFLD